MPVFRTQWLKTFLTFLTGVIFLNMGFFLLEVKVLGLDQDKQLMENISRMVAGAALEEERDYTPQSSGFAEEEYLAGHHSGDHAASLFLISENASHLFDDGICHHGYVKKFNPPPEG